MGASSTGSEAGFRVRSPGAQPGPDSAFKERLAYAMETSGYRNARAVETALMVNFPDIFKHQGQLSSYMTGRRGKNYPDPKLVKALADTLHVTFEWLMIGTGPLRPEVRRGLGHSGEYQMDRDVLPMHSGPVRKTPRPAKKTSLK